MRCIKLSKKIEKKIVCKTTYVSKGPDVTPRNLLDHKNSDVSSMARVICKRGTLTRFHQRVAIGRTRIYKDKQYIQRINEFSSMYSITEEVIKKMYIYVDSWSLPKNSIIHAMNFQNHQNDALRCIIFGIYGEGGTTTFGAMTLLLIVPGACSALGTSVDEWAWYLKWWPLIL